MDIILDQSSEDLLCCRVCLMTDCRLFNIHEYKLADTLSRISGTPIFKGRLPQYLCTYCHTLLLKCAKFRTRCLRTDQGLKKEVLKGELNTDRIRRIDRGTSRLFNLTLTEAEIVDIPPSEKINEPNVDIGVPKIEQVFKVEPSTISKDDDIDDTNDYETNSMDLVANMHTYNVKAVNADDEPSIQTDEDKDIEEPNPVEMDEANTHTVTIDAPNIQKVGVVKRIIDKDMQETRFDTDNIAFQHIRKPELKMELEMLKGQLKIKVVKDARNVDTIPALQRIRPEMEASKVKVKKVGSVANKMRTGKENNTMMLPRIINTSEEKEAQIQIIKTSQDIFNNPGMLNPCLVRKLNRASAIKRKRLWFPKDPANNYLQEFDYSKFERDNAVKIVTLSKGEQLEEIAARKQSTNYTTAPFPCEDCGKGFGMEASYNNHRQRHSPSAGEYFCDICSVRFNKRSHRQGHLDTHRLKFNCERCHFVSRSKHQAKAHYDMHEGKTFDCPHCEKTYNKQSTYFSHVRISHPSAHVACDLCGETFIGARGIYVHKQLVHRHAQIIKPQQFKCTACAATFVSQDALQTHADFGDHAGCPCEQCGESCASEEALRAHVGARHQAEAHWCEECNKTFSSAAAFDVHHRRKHLNQRYIQPPGRSQYQYLKKRRPVRGQFMCEQCGRILPSSAILRIHINNHLDVKPFPCPHCPKTFATNYWRNEHVRRHTGEKPYQCDRCPRAFCSKSNMMRHNKVVHLGQHDNAICTVCGRVCTTRGSLRVHFRAVHLGQGWPKRPNRKKPARKPSPAPTPEPSSSS